MTDNNQTIRASELLNSAFTWSDGTLAILSGLLSAGVAALFVCERWSLAAFIAFVVVLLAATENESFLLLTIFSIPLGSAVRAGGPLHDIPGTIRLLTVIGFFLGRGLRNRLDLTRLLHAPISQISVCFFGVALASVVFADEGWTYDAARGLYRLASYIGFFLFVVEWAKGSRERVRKILQVLLYSTIMTAGFAIFQEFIQGHTSFWLHLYPPDENYGNWDGRATSFLNYSNSLAGYLNLLMPVALALSIVGKGSWRKLGIWSLLLGFAALLSTQSVGGLAAFLAVIVLAAFGFAKGPRSRLVLLVAIVLLISVLYGARTILNPSHMAGAVGPDAVSRLVMWNTAWNFFLGSPVLGIGWNNFTALYGFYTASMSFWIPPGLYAVHNIYLQLLAETGFVGLIVFLYLLLRCWIDSNAYRRVSTDCVDKALAFGVQGAIVAVLVHGSVDFLFQASPQFGTLFWGVLGLGLANGTASNRATVLKCA